MIRKIVCCITLSFIASWSFAQNTFQKQHAIIQSQREDGRLQSSYAIAHHLLEDLKPQYRYHEGMTKKAFRRWQKGLRNAMEELMQFPKIKGQPSPKRISCQERKGYTLEKWEFYPFPQSVATFLVLKPNGITQRTPAILCIPGSGRTKEGLAGEAGICDRFSEDYHDPKVAMARDFVEQGYIAVAVDHAASGEMSDLEQYHMGKNYDYDVVSRLLLEMGWHWLGYTSYLDKLVLDWMKTQPEIDRKQIALSGFSLGTEPMMVLGVLDPEIHAFIYNDFLCQTQERALVMTMPNEKGRRGFPNSIRHLIPNYWKYFNFPDVVAALAPRPIILTEGGLDRDFRLIQSAYQVAGHPENMVFYHYPKFAEKDKRHDIEALPKGLNRDAFFELANVDPPMHYFKYKLILPWLKTVFHNGSK